MITEDEYSTVRWNVFNYALYHSKLNLFDWLMSNFNCSIM